MLQVKWLRCGTCWRQGARYLARWVSAHAKGVYLVYQKTPDGWRVIKIGIGQIRNRMRDHRLNPEITCEAVHGELLVVCAEVPMDHALSIERYLSRCYRPKRGSVHWVPELPVNLPFRKWVPYAAGPSIEINAID